MFPRLHSNSLLDTRVTSHFLLRLRKWDKINQWGKHKYAKKLTKNYEKGGIAMLIAKFALIFVMEHKVFESIKMVVIVVAAHT